MSNLANTPGSVSATIGGTITTNQVAYGSGANTIQGNNNFTFDGTSFVLGSPFGPTNYIQTIGSSGNDFVIYSNGTAANMVKVDGTTSRILFNETNSNAWRTIIGSLAGDYPLTVTQDGTSPLGVATIQIGIQNDDAEVGIALDNTGTNGDNYFLFSTNDASGFGAGNFIIMNSNGSVRFKTTTAGDTEINTVTRAFSAGDIDGTNLGTLLQVDDSTGFTAMRNLDDGIMSVPKVTTIGDTSLVNTYIQVSNSSAPGKITTKLPAYADNAAALIGGLTTGDLYQTDGTAILLPVAGVVMIVQ